MIGNILQYAIAIFILQGALIHGHLSKLDVKIDDYIDKLLTSHKFEILVEKIANKAVEKILNQQPKLRIRPSNETVSLQKKTVFNISHETDVRIEETPTDLKNLSLKYKYFAKVPSDEGKITKNNKIPKKKRLNISEPIPNVNDFQTDFDNSQTSDIESKQQEEINKSDQQEDVNNSVHTEKLNKKTLNDKNGNVVNMEETNAEDSISMENKRNEVFLESESNSMDRENSKPEGHVSEFDHKVEKDKSLFENEFKIEPKSLEPKTNRKKRFRSEGNRIFTFMSSSDYDEYHQELDKIEMKRKVYI